MMRKFRHIVSIAAVGAVALLVTTCLATATEAEQQHANTALATGKTAKSAATAKTLKRSAVALAAQPAAEQKEHRLILQVNTNDAAAMNLALNNATNVAEYYEKAGEPVKIEVVTFGPGLNMLREDTSPVKARIETMALSTPEVSFKACGITRENMRKAEDKDIPIIPQAEVVPSGVVRVMQREEEGWSYVKP
jgi:intracellular sulfur oxidation DsrE/DsrF family protein